MTEVGQTESVADGGRKIGHMKREEREVEEEERRGENGRKRMEERRGGSLRKERGQGD